MPDGESVYHHKEWSYRSKRASEDISVNLSPYGWIILDIINDKNEKDSAIISEIQLKMMMRKAAKFTSMIEGYEAGEYEIFDIQTGRLISGIPGEVDVSYAKMKLKFSIAILDSGLIGMTITVNDKMSTELSVYDWLDIMYKLRNIDYTQMNMLAINYLGSPDIGGKHMSQIGKKFDVYDDSIADQYEINVTQIKSEQSGIKSAKSILEVPKPANKINTRGW